MALSNILSGTASTLQATGTGDFAVGLNVASSGEGTARQNVTGAGAFAVSLLVACTGTGTVQQPQPQGTGDFSVSISVAQTGEGSASIPQLSNILSGVATTLLDEVTGSGNFAVALQASQTGDGQSLMAQLVSGSGDFGVQLAVAQTGDGNAGMGIENTGSGQDWPVSISVSMSGVGLVEPFVPQQVAGSGAFAAALQVAQAGEGSVFIPQQVAGNGDFAVGLSFSQVGGGVVTPLPPLVGSGSFGVALSVSMDGEGLVTTEPPQEVSGTGSFSASLLVSSSGEGTVTPDTWDDGPANIWDEVSYNIADNTPVFILGTKFFAADQGEEFVSLTAGNYSFSPVATLLERIGLPVLREGKPDPGRIKLVRGVYPIFEGTEGVTVNISVGAQQNLKKVVEWEGPYGFEIGEDFFSDFFTSGRYVAVRYETAALADWKLQGYDLDIQPLGER